MAGRSNITVMSLIRDAAHFEPNRALPQLIPGFWEGLSLVAMVCFIALLFASVEVGSPTIHHIYALNIVLYGVGRFNGKDAGRMILCVGFCVVPAVDLALNVYNLPSPEQLDAFFDSREYVQLFALCVGMTVSVHELAKLLAFALAVTGLSWAVVACGTGDRRPLLLFAPLTMLPCALGYELMRLATAAHASDARLREMYAQLELARRQDMVQAALMRSQLERGEEQL